MAMQEEVKEYDIVFCGGGTAACVTAGRLAKANPDLSILLIESGKNNLNDPTVINPAIFLANLAPDSQKALLYKAKASKHLNGREAVVSTGGMLGGGSSINFMMYTRAQGCDYDSWKTEGWDFKSLLPFFKKFETYHSDDPSIDRKLHGYSGPINVSHGTWDPKGPQDDLIAAAESVDEPEIPDLADFKSCGGFSRWAHYMSPDGKRQDTAHRYIHNENLPNIDLQVESKVVRVLFDDNAKATGVEYERTRSFQPEVALSKPLSSTVRARKLVVVSSGALGTPLVHERSGIGNASLLSALDINVVSDLPGVGHEYQDHHFLFMPYKTSLKPEETLDGLYGGRLDFAQAVEENNPIIGWNAIHTAKMGSEVQEIWDRDFKDNPERPLMLIASLNMFLGDHTILNEDAEHFMQYATMGAFTPYPYSRGSIHITSKSAQAPPDFDTGFLNHPADLAVQVWAYKKQREIYRRTNAYPGEVALGHPRFREGSKAVLSDGPVVEEGFKSLEERKAVPPIEYDEEDDKAIETWIRDTLQTTWHSLGTCKMAPREEGGVVDKDLNVYGTKGLKIADMSICPENVAANTNNTAIMIGEKAAAIIADELGLKL